MLNTVELTHKIHELKELQALIAEAEAEAEAIKDAIKAEMGEQTELRCGVFTVRYQPITTSRLDSKALTAAAPELAARFTKTTTVRRFTIA